MFSLSAYRRQSRRIQKRKKSQSRRVQVLAGGEGGSSTRKKKHVHLPIVHGASRAPVRGRAPSGPASPRAAVNPHANGLSSCYYCCCRCRRRWGPCPCPSRRVVVVPVFSR